jgi:hypothetical protein
VNREKIESFFLSRFRRVVFYIINHQSKPDRNRVGQECHRKPSRLVLNLNLALEVGLMKKIEPAREAAPNFKDPGVSLDFGRLKKQSQLYRRPNERK